MHRAGFRAQPVNELNNSPQHRSDITELAAMLRYAAAKPRRAALLRFLQISVATLARPDGL